MTLQTSMSNTSVPHFLIIGAQKAGTTALYQYLNMHPWCKSALHKEVGFFAFETKYSRGEQWYKSQFCLEQAVRDCKYFEATPEYVYYPECPGRIFEYNPKIKLIVLLRNPVERAFSSWNMFYGIFKTKPHWFIEFIRDIDEPVRNVMSELLALDEPPSFEMAITQEIDQIGSPQSDKEPSYVRRGIYWEQLTRYFRLFYRDDILILDSKDFRLNRNRIMNLLLNFLDLPQSENSLAVADTINEGVYTSKIDLRTRDMLSEFYKPHNEKLYALVGYDFRW
jgi:hypothetical protein